VHIYIYVVCGVLVSMIVCVCVCVWRKVGQISGARLPWYLENSWWHLVFDSSYSWFIYIFSILKFLVSKWCLNIWASSLI
jgi:hypothetical protein